jgi:hypothetical protein
MGNDYRFQPQPHVGRAELSKTEPEREAENLRTSIRGGNFQSLFEPSAQNTMTFDEFADFSVHLAAY